MAYTPVKHVPNLSITPHAMTLLSLSGGDAARIAKAIQRLFTVCGNRDSGGEIPPDPDDLSEIGQEAYEALKTDVLSGIDKYWAICDARKPKEVPPPPDISQTHADLSQTHAGQLINNIVSEEVKKENNDLSEIAHTPELTAHEALMMIKSAGIEVDNGLQSFLINECHKNEISQNVIERAIQWCMQNNLRTPREITGAIQKIKTDSWR